MSPDELLTKRDLEDFKQELFALLGKGAPAQQKWLKNKDVTAMLGISAGKLQTLRENGALAFSKVGGNYFYKLEDIEQMLSGAEKKTPVRR